MRFLLFLFLGLTLIPAHSQSTAGPTVSSFSIDAPQLGGQRKIWVYVPKDYAAGDKKYPVLYIHDGQNLFDASTSFAGEWNVDETLDSLKLPLIVVGIENGGDKRIDELTPYPHKKYGGGKADSYLDFLVNTLKPKIDATYRTKSGKKFTGIMGSSLGGLVSFYALLKYPDVFSKAGIFSPSFWFSPQVYEMMEKAPKTKAKMYFLCGDNESKEMVPDMRKMVSVVAKNRCDCLNLTKEVEVPGGEHNEKLWRENFGRAVKWLF
ncbi:alpha/beta hydrolase [Flavobacterium silvaticum]|uniref:Alpha/beta hydrolase n=1 Tax=Flavobacterium silvaticum TaxID=1852020 RepID=A0A972FLH6_9FLAO|nr:alpha/beta hydrolase-fold protein [Flavobacterium silvaticum]NMH27918.1 alpha/beta hydrolase [Flavobacterium silvaticum]